MTMQVAIDLTGAEHDAFDRWLASTAATINPDDPRLDAGEAIRAMIGVTMRYADIARVARERRQADGRPGFGAARPDDARVCRCLLGGLGSVNADREQAAGLLWAQVTLKSGRWPRAGRAQRRPCAVLLASNLEWKVPRLVLGGLDDVALGPGQANA